MNSINQQSITQYQKKKMELLLQLGQKTHSKLLVNDFDIQELFSISTSILALDQQIHRLTKEAVMRARTHSTCLKCNNVAKSEAKFCGTCGQPNPVYEANNGLKKVCKVCDESIQFEAQFCPCCGVPQGGM